MSPHPLINRRGDGRTDEPHWRPKRRTFVTAAATVMEICIAVVVGRRRRHTGINGVIRIMCFGGVTERGWMDGDGNREKTPLRTHHQQ